VQVGADKLDFQGDWQPFDGGRQSSTEGASADYRFTGNQVRVLGTVDADGGWADAFIDGQKQLTVVECWNPTRRRNQPIFIKKGLSNGPHEVKIVVRGAKNTISKGAVVRIDGVQFSNAAGSVSDGVGEGPTSAQRMVFGYLGRDPIIDSQGHAWLPATEWVVRSGFSMDTVDKAMWTKRRSMYIGNTKDEELYRYGAHGSEFWVNLTVGPGKYDLRLKFADTPLTAWMEREGQWDRVLHDDQVFVNGKEIMPPTSISKEAGGIFMAVDKEVKDVVPEHGMIRVHFVGTNKHEACVQALELVPSG
ncbi:MAG TPA: malectin domain-containing carbohydrate-binding protein, partial [Fimbriimonas sp.]|nr:malectin domain-containing carbohydrate-binding protein [Fimbriimonas sp.]